MLNTEATKGLLPTSLRSNHISTLKQRLLLNRKSIKSIAAKHLRPCKYALADHEQTPGKKEKALQHT